MLKFLVKALGLIAGLALSGAVCAVGMGGINVTTALGEPLKAEIELVAVGKIEKGSLSARLASPDAFKGAGMDYPAGLPQLKFLIETRTDGGQYLKLTSALPVNEPFVSLLVELSWSSGRLLREYTFLLDPPGYKAEQPKAAEVAPVLSKAEGPVLSKAEGAAAQTAAEREYQRQWTETAKKEAAMRATAPVDEKAFAAAKKPAEGGIVASGPIKVKHGDTLSQIARETKSSDVSLERMLVALYRANADAFDGNNMNRLRAGKILRMPEQSDLGKLAQMDAVKEIHVQVADWHAYRQKLAAASGRVAEQAPPKQEASGKISTTVADKAPAAKESAKEVVKLSKGEAPGDKTAAGGNAKSLQDKIHALEEEAIARGKALKESNERVALLEKNIKEMQRLLELKGQPAVTKPETAKPEAKAEPAKVEAKQPPTPAPAAPVAAPSLTAKPAATTPAAAPPAAAKPAAKPVAAPKVVAPPPSVMDEPLYLAGGAAALLALGGLGFVLLRRKGVKFGKKAPDSKKAVEDTDIGARISAPIAPSPETGDFTQTSAVAPIIQEPEDVDPISEADLFLNFGRDAQAEEILKDALGKSPANNQIRLKLLSIYAKRKDTNSFSSIARPIQDSGDAAAWAQAAEMGRSLEPNNPMYGATGDEPVAVAAVEQDKSEQQPAGLDFDLGFGAPEAAAAPEAESTTIPDASLAQNADTTSVMDFDLGIGEPETAATPEAESTMALNALPGEEADMSMADLQFAPMDFDITATHPPSAAAAGEPDQAAAITPNLDDLVFDITAVHPSLAEAAEEKPAADIPAGNDGGMEFTLDFPMGEEPEVPAAQVADKETIDLDLDNISLDMEQPAALVPASDAKDAHWHDVATKLDLAKAYQEMGDNAGAREILEEVLAEGDEQQRATAEATIKQLLT